jgi:hypothetical protein
MNINIKTCSRQMTVINPFADRNIRLHLFFCSLLLKGSGSEKASLMRRWGREEGRKGNRYRH